MAGDGAALGATDDITIREVARSEPDQTPPTAQVWKEFTPLPDPARCAQKPHGRADRDTMLI
jgi:hypothetical protein